jgi:hypothetical protein
MASATARETACRTTGWDCVAGHRCGMPGRVSGTQSACPAHEQRLFASSEALRAAHRMLCTTCLQADLSPHAATCVVGIAFETVARLIAYESRADLEAKARRWPRHIGAVCAVPRTMRMVVSSMDGMDRITPLIAVRARLSLPHSLICQALKLSISRISHCPHVWAFVSCRSCPMTQASVVNIGECM